MKTVKTVKTVNNPSDYVAIRFWGVKLGSRATYIYSEQEKAAEAGAPIDSIYMTPTGVWRTLRDVTNPDVISDARKIGLLV